MKRNRLLAVGVATAVVAVLAFLAFGGLGESLVYYWSPSELYAAGERAEGASVRLGGQVAAGSIEREPDGLTLRFRVTDGSASVPVFARAVPPAMFREGIGVVVEGTLLPDGTFESSRLMVKHDNEYRAPEAGETPSIEELARTVAAGEET